MNRGLRSVFILLLFASLLYAYSTIRYKQNIFPELTIRETIDLIDEIKKEINNPPPLKHLNGSSDFSNLSTEGILKLTNHARLENGNLSALKGDLILDTIAQKRLQDMFQNQYFEHVSPSGVSVSDVAHVNGYEYIIIGENIALGNFKDDEALVKAWMDSPGHRANILNGRYTTVGIAAMRGEYENRTTWMAIQVFSLPLSACARIDELLKQKIDINKQKIGELENFADNLRAELDNFKPETRKDVSLYNDKVKIYNNTVAELNDLVDETKKQVSLYNKQVEMFNECASGK